MDLFEARRDVSFLKYTILTLEPNKGVLHASYLHPRAGFPSGEEKGAGSKNDGSDE
jgi:hypothetical protein